MRSRLLAALLAAVLACLVLVGFSGAPAMASSYTPITGEGSSWAANAIDAWRADVHNQYAVNFAATGSVAGLTGFANAGQGDDFVASDIPYGVKGTSPNPPGRGYEYIPDVAGGTALMYNLTVGGKPFTNLKLSGATIAGIFEGDITQWNDPKIEADNPGVPFPPLKITPVVRSDGSGSTAQFSLWMKKQFPSVWTCGEISFFSQCNKYSPTVQKAEAGDNGVAGFVAQASNVGSIGYVEYSYALQSGKPVAKVLNKAGFYVLPTASNVAVALLKAKLDMHPGVNYLTQDLDAVYTDPDPRTYPISSYSYFVAPTVANQAGLTTDKGYTLSSFIDFALCQGQKQAPALGYSPLPINLVEASFPLVKKIPGAVAQNISIKSCDNPTFSTDGTNTLAKTALYPDLCDKQGAKATCVYGTPARGTTSASTNGQTDNNAVGAKNTGGTTTATTTGGTTTTATGGSTTTGTTTGGQTGGGTTSTSGKQTGATSPGTAPGGAAPAGDAASGGTGGGTVSLLNPDGKTVCDPDTGQCTQLSASPVEVPAAHGSIRWSIWIAIAVLVALVLVPPAMVLASRRVNR